MMRALILILSVAVCSTTAVAADERVAYREQQAAIAAKEEAQRRNQSAGFAFLLGMSIAGKDSLSWEGFYPSESPQRNLYDRKARLLAVALGFAKIETGTREEESEWKFRILRLMEPFYTPAAFQGGVGFTEILEQPSYWDDASRRAYLVGAYCRYGHGDRIGYLPTSKAWFVAHLLGHFCDGRLEVTTLVGPIAPGGSKIDLPSDPKIREIVAEAKKLLAEEEPNQ